MASLYTKGVPHLPIPRGNESAGVMDFSSSGSNGILFRLFYPCAFDRGELNSNPYLWTAYSLGYEYCLGSAKFVTQYCQSYLGLFFQLLIKNMRFPAVYNGQAMEGKWPVIIISHGIAGNRGLFTTIATDLASHGYIVSVIEHRDGSASGSFFIENDGTRIWKRFEGYKDVGQMDIRIQEIFKVHSALKDLNDGNFTNAINETDASIMKQLTGKFDLDNIILFGHSYGAATVIKILASQENIFKAGILFDPWMAPIRKEYELFATSITVPLLCIAYEGFFKGPNKNAIIKFTNLLSSSMKECFLMKHSDHLHGNDAPWILGSYGWWLYASSAQTPVDIVKDLQHNMVFLFLSKVLSTTSPFLQSYDEFVLKHKHLLLEIENQ